MTVSVIIINYNTTKLLLDCLFSIKKQTQNIDYEIIVIDNASTEVLDAISINFPDVILIKLEQNIGFGKANNKGFEIAKGEFVFLLNSDTILLNNAVKTFADFMSNHKTEKIGAIGGQLLEIDGLSKNHSSSAFPSLRSEFKEEVNRISRALFKKDLLNKPNEKLLPENENFIEVDYVTGADLFMPTSVLKEIGCFDPQFFMYYEETDLQKRMQTAAYKRLIIANTKIVHLEGGSFDATKKISGKRLLMIEESKFKYFKKHKSSIAYYSYRVVYLFSSLPLLFKSAIPLEYRIKLLKRRLSI
jgi:GT2 family glycosyltransferase